MLKAIVFKQKQDKERLLSLSYIERTKEKDAQKWLSSDLIKVILGPRRAGKSVFALMLLKEQSFAYFNFDDESLPGKEKIDLDKLISHPIIALPTSDISSNPLKGKIIKLNIKNEQNLSQLV